MGTSRLAATLTAVLLLASCGSDTSGSQTPDGDAAAPSTSPTERPSESDLEPSPSETAESDPVALTAGDLTAALTCSDLPTGDRVVHTAESDPNDLLGAPDGYQSRSDLVDTRVADTLDGVDSGAVVEGFADAAGADARAAYITGVIEELDMPGLAEWQYLIADRFLLRVTGQLEETQAQEYADALADLPAGGPIDACDGSGAAAPPDQSDLRQAQSLLSVEGDISQLATADGQVTLATTLTDPRQIAFVAHNGTDEPISRLAVSGRIVDGDGATITTGESQGIVPNVIEPGGIAIGIVFAGGEQLPDDASLSDPAIDYTTGLGDFENIIGLQVDQVERTPAGDVIGDATNPHDIPVDGPVSVAAACLDADGQLTAYASTFADRDTVPPGESTTFTIEFFADSPPPCDTLIVGASGYGEV